MLLSCATFGIDISIMKTRRVLCVVVRAQETRNQSASQQSQQPQKSAANQSDNKTSSYTVVSQSDDGDMDSRTAVPQDKLNARA